MPINTVPWLAPKLVPMMVMLSPTTPEGWLVTLLSTEVIVITLEGTVKLKALLDTIPPIPGSETLTLYTAPPAGIFGTLSLISFGDQFRSAPLIMVGRPDVGKNITW